MSKKSCESSIWKSYRKKDSYERIPVSYWDGGILEANYKCFASNKTRERLVIIKQ